jgi:tetratricopeptide (TPR) repeat protein
MHKQSALAAITQRDFHTAFTILDQLRQTHPRDPEVFNLIGGVLAELDRPAEAEAAFRRAIALKPDYAAASNNLANVLLDRGDRELFREAEKLYRGAIRSSPALVAAHQGLGTCLQSLGDYRGAIEAYQSALQLQPGQPAALAGMALALDRLGRVTEAAEVLAHRGADQMQDPNLLVAVGEIALHTKKERAALEEIESALGPPQGVLLKPYEQTSLRFLAGRLSDRLGEYDRAFEHFSIANALSTVPYDIERTIRDLKRIEEVFSSAAQVSRPRSSNRSKVPVFIVGLPRSGTTLIEQILASHPLVHGAGELDTLAQTKVMLQRESRSARVFPEVVDDVPRRGLDTIARHYLDQLERYAMGRARVTDKMPHNFELLGLVDLLFPAGRIIHCVRDPRDTCLSMYFQHFNQHHGYANDLVHLGRYYRAYLDLMNHWHETLRVPILQIRYENLVASPEIWIPRLIEFCELPWNEQCLRFYESGRVVDTPSYDQVRQPLYSNSLARYRRYERHIQPLTQALGDAIEESS